jgi:hypothetical protein
MDKGQMIDAIISELQEGATMAQTCQGPLRPHINSLKLWMRSSQEIADRVLTARQLGCWNLLDTVMAEENPDPRKLGTIKYIITRLTPKGQNHENI